LLNEMALTREIIVQVGTLLLASLGVLVAISNQRRQLNAQMFIELSKRFQELLRMFPTDAWLANRNPNQPLPPPSQAITDCTLLCFQLMADVYHVRRARYVSNAMYRGWEREMKHILQGRVFRREWEQLKVEFLHNEDFLRYINELIETEVKMVATAAPSDPLVDGF
jgi:hypothetical protein